MLNNAEALKRLYSILRQSVKLINKYNNFQPIFELLLENNCSDEDASFIIDSILSIYLANIWPEKEL